MRDTPRTGRSYGVRALVLSATRLVILVISAALVSAIHKNNPSSGSELEPHASERFGEMPPLLAQASRAIAAGVKGLTGKLSRVLDDPTSPDEAPPPLGCPGHPPCSGNGKCNLATSTCVCLTPFMLPDCSASVQDALKVRFPCYEEGDPVPGSVEPPPPKSSLPPAAMAACKRATEPDGACRAYLLSWQSVCRRMCPSLQNASCARGGMARACESTVCVPMVSYEGLCGSYAPMRVPPRPLRLQCESMVRWFCESAGDLYTESPPPS